MKKDLTELVFILDKSGSMSGLEKDTIGGFNSLIEKQKHESGEAIVSTILFSNEIEVIHDRINLLDVSKLTRNEYYVSGTTALLDALGFTISRIKHVHDNLKDEDRPEKTLFIITTDGMENSSEEFSYQKVKKLIDKMKENNKYEFIFLGANIDSVKEASRLGIDVDQAVNYKNDEAGIDINYKAISEAICGFRKEKTLSKKWRETIDSNYKRK